MKKSGIKHKFENVLDDIADEELVLTRLDNKLIDFNQIIIIIHRKSSLGFGGLQLLFIVKACST